jgi:hypothetical protein
MEADGSSRGEQRDGASRVIGSDKEQGDGLTKRSEGRYRPKYLGLYTVENNKRTEMEVL